MASLTDVRTLTMRALALGSTTLACSLILISGPVPVSAKERNEINSFCTDKTVRDYRSPFRRMRTLREVPELGHLPFAPRGVLIRVLDDGLRVGPGAIGFALIDNAIDQDRLLNWRITARLVRVDGRGRSGGLLKTRVWSLGTVDLHGEKGRLRLPVSGHPAFYRMDVIFRNSTGKILGSYAAYFRVVKPNVDIKLALNDQVLEQGQVPNARVENLGTESVAPDSRISLEQFDGQGWHPITSYLTPGLRPGLRTVLPAGQAARCVEIRVPNEQGAGLYRITSKVALWRSPSRQVALSKIFRVKPAVRKPAPRHLASRKHHDDRYE
jgi:hypothetical protein